MTETEDSREIAALVEAWRKTAVDPGGGELQAIVRRWCASATEHGISPARQVEMLLLHGVAIGGGGLTGQECPYCHARGGGGHGGLCPNGTTGIAGERAQSRDDGSGLPVQESPVLTVTGFIEARLAEITQAAMAASSDGDQATGKPERWRWECSADDVALNLDTDAYISAAGRMLFHCDDWRTSLRSIEEYPDGDTPMPHLVISTAEPVRPVDARHILLNDPNRAARTANGIRKQMEVIGRMVETKAIDLVMADALRYWIAVIWDDHPDYRQAGEWTS